MMQTFRRIGTAVLATAIVAASLAVAVLFFLVRGQGWLVQTVATGSMEPTVPTGSVILSRPVDAAEIQAGDVIVFRSPTGATVSGGSDGVFEATEAMLITHRVVAVEGEGDQLAFRTKGDGNAEQDPWQVTASMVRARYVGHVPGVGGFLSLPGMRRWLFLGVGGVGLAVIVVETRTLVRELRARPDPAATPSPRGSLASATAEANASVSTEDD